MTILPELRARPQGPEGEADILWYHPGFCRFALPPRPGGTEAWQREADGTSVAFEPATERDRVPGGPLLRRLLMHLCDSAIRAAQPQLGLGDSAAALAAAMRPPVPAELAPVLEAQAGALFGCRIVVATEGGPGLSVLDARGRPRAGAAVEWRSAVRLNARFLDNLQRDKVALDRAAIAALQTSALALDLYTWLATALPEQRDQAVQAESWPELRARFGAPGQDADAFQADCSAALALLRRALPGLDIDEDAIGVGFSARTAGAAPAASVPQAPIPAAPAPAAPAPVAAAAAPQPPAPPPAAPVAEQPAAPAPRQGHWRRDSRPDAPRFSESPPDQRVPEARVAEPRAPEPRPEERRNDERQAQDGDRFPRGERDRNDRDRNDRDRNRPERFAQDRDRPDRDRQDRDRQDRDRDEREFQDRDRQDRERYERQPGQARQTISLRSHLTGLQQVVWLQRAQGRDNVVIEVTPGTRYDPALATVLTLEPMVLQIAGGLHAREFERVSSWAAANRDLIDAFWDGEIDGFDEILSRVRKVPAPGADRWRA